jgi:hypothetical protein
VNKLKTKTGKEIVLMMTILIISYFLFRYFDILERIVEWSKKHEEYEVDELLSTSIVLVVLLLIFAIRRWVEVLRTAKKLQDTLDEIKTLRGIIPICSYCKQIRDDEGSWSQLESYIYSHSDAEFSHGVCPECYKKQMEKLESEK